MDLSLRVPRHSTLSQRRRILDIQPLKPWAQGPTERNCRIKMIGDHGRRSLVETAFGRYKSTIGDSLRARDEDAQVTEVAIAIKALNRMIRAAKPISIGA